MKKYTEVVRRDAVLMLKELRETGTIKMDGDENFRNIENVRDLCGYLGISSDTLYRWQKEFSIQVAQMNDDYDEIIPKRIVCYVENWCKAYQSDYDEGYGNCNMLGDCNGFKNIDDVAKELIFKDKVLEAYNNGGDEHESESEYYMTPKEIDDLKMEASGDDFDDIHYEKETRIATKGDKKIGNGKYKRFKTTDAEKKEYGERVEKEIQGFLKLPVKKTKSKISVKFNFSIELNLIKCLYANRFGSSTNKTKAHMLRALTNAWSEK